MRLYLKNTSKLTPIKPEAYINCTGKDIISKGYMCPRCGTGLKQNDDKCPRCYQTISWER